MKLSFCAACGSKDDLQHNHLVMRSEVASAYLAALGAQLLSLKDVSASVGVSPNTPVMNVMRRIKPHEAHGLHY